MAEITDVGGEETDVMTNEEAIKNSQIKDEFSPPVMWAQGEDEDDEDEGEEESAQSLVRRLLDRLP